MHKTFCNNVISFFLALFAFFITIQTLAFFIVIAVIAFVFIAHADLAGGAPLVDTTISILTIIVGNAAIVAHIRSCTELLFATS